MSGLRSRVLEVVARRIAALHDGAPTRIAVDGVDGAGKTVFADELAEVLRTRGCEVVRVSVDGFHHLRHLRYRRGRSSPLGFYLDSHDLEALQAKVLDPLAPDGDRRIVRAIHDVAREQPVDLPAETVGGDAVLLVDGIFLHRPELRSAWDLSVFLEVPFELSVPRGNARFGGDPDPTAATNRRYVEGQRHYLESCRPQQRATFVIDNSDLDAPRILTER